MSNWGYVAIAYVIVWGTLAAYALIMARRVTQARDVVDTLQDSSESDRLSGDRDLA